MKTKLNMKNLGFGAITLVAASFLMSFAINGGWVVPDAEAAKKNPVASNEVSIADGKALYLKHCKMCHGVTGEGGKMAGESNFKSPAFKAQTDGAIFYKTNSGFGKMPSFKTKIADDKDKWSVVNYMRSL